MRLLWRSGIDVEAIVLYRESASLVADAAKLSIEVVSDRSFVARDRFDVDELASERDSVHAVTRISDTDLGAADCGSQNSECSSESGTRMVGLSFCILTSDF
jgi:hypothetical protein